VGASSPLLGIATADFAFVNHDQHTLNNNLPPAVDNKSLARQKRRRTRYVAYIKTSQQA
jgi:hypothetical protein